MAGSRKGGAEGGTEPGNIADKAPPIYLEQTVVALHDGRPPTAMDGIQLRHERAKDTGIRWRTTRMIVGGEGGGDLFAVPAGITMAGD